MKRLFEHVRRQAVGYVALVVALGGTSYAAVELPRHSVNPVNLNPHAIGGYVRAWVSVNANGRIGASGGGVKVIVDSAVGPGHYIVDWHPRPSSPCRPIGSVDLTRGVLVPGYLIATAASTKARGEQSVVQTYDPQGQPTTLAFDLELLCTTPR